MCPTIVPLMRETKREQDIYFTSLIDTMKILVATEKPFAKKAVDGIRGIVENAGYELALLEKYTDKSELLEAVADADALIVRSDKVTAEVIAAAKNLKIVVRAGAGYDNVDLAAASARGIVVMNTPGQNSNAVAELALAMMIYMSRNRFTPGTGSEIQGKTLGIHQLLFRSYLTFFFYLFQKKLFFYVVQLLYLITHALSCQELFFIYLKIFFPISFKSMCSHVQRMLSYHRVCVTSSVFSLFYFFF